MIMSHHFAVRRQGVRHADDDSEMSFVVMKRPGTGRPFTDIAVCDSSTEADMIVAALDVFVNGPSGDVAMEAMHRQEIERLKSEIVRQHDRIIQMESACNEMMHERDVAREQRDEASKRLASMARRTWLDAPHMPDLYRDPFIHTPPVPADMPPAIDGNYDDGPEDPDAMYPEAEEVDDGQEG